MLLSDDTQTRNIQFELISQLAEAGVPDLVPGIYQNIQRQDKQHKLLHLDQAMPTLKEMSKQQYQRFYDLIGKLIVADQAVDIFEWVVHRVLTQELYAHFVRPFRGSGRISRTNKVQKQVGLVLSLLATLGSSSEDERQLAYQRGLEHWGGKQSMTRLDYFDYQELNQALDKLRDLNADLTQRFIDACAHVVNADRELTGDEFALIKGVATTLGCPLPPLEQKA